MNAVLEEMLWYYVNPSQDNWEGLLPLTELASNNAYHPGYPNPSGLWQTPKSTVLCGQTSCDIACPE